MTPPAEPGRLRCGFGIAVLMPARWCSFPAALVCLVGVPLAGAADAIPFTSERWTIEAREHRVEEHLGRESLYLQGGLAWVDDAIFTDGIIEFDVAFGGERGFAGAVWRMQDAANHEEFYLRPHQSGNPDATQYTPIFHGLPGWQLYHGEGYGAAVPLPANAWIRVRVVFSGSRGEVYVEDMSRPLVVIGEMKRAVAPGKAGLMVANFAPAHFSEFRLRPLADPPLGGPFRVPDRAPAGTVSSWLVSSAFSEASLAARTHLADSDRASLSWTRLDAESTGVTNLARIQAVTPAANTAFARVVVSAERPGVSRLRFGYSDRVRVYLNDRLLYAGNNGYRSRDYRFLGTIGLFDELYLLLEAGRNELWFAVSESFGGWGLMAALEDSPGVRLDAPTLRGGQLGQEGPSGGQGTSRGP